MTLLDTTQDTIRTARLALRPLRGGDDVRIFELFAHWEILRFLSSPPWPYAPEDARAFVRTRMAPNPDFITSAITRDGALIGVIDAIIKPPDAAQRERGYTLGYWLAQRYWDRGLMTEAARAFVAHVFAMTREETIYCGAMATNAASLRVQEKIGFERDCEAMAYSAPHGKEVPIVGTVLTRTRFAALTAAA